MSEFHLSRINDDVDRIFGDLSDANENMKSVEEMQAERELVDQKMHMSDFERRTKGVTGFFGTDFESLMNKFEQEIPNIKEVKEEKVGYKDPAKNSCVTEKEAIARTKKMLSVQNDFKAKDFAGDDELTDDEYKHQRTQQAVNMGMEVSESDAINDPNSKSYRAGSVTERPATQKVHSFPDYTAPKRQTADTTIGVKKASTTTTGSKTEADGMRERYEAFFRQSVNTTFKIGSNRISGWKEDKVLSRNLTAKANRYERSGWKRQLNKVKVYLQSKRFKITMKVASLVSLNIIMGITTKTVEFESLRQILGLVAISVGGFYISQELTGDGINVSHTLF